jgi:hypothetical protein
MLKETFLTFAALFFFATPGMAQANDALTPTTQSTAGSAMVTTSTEPDGEGVSKPDIAPYVWGGLLQDGTGINQFYASVMLGQRFHSIRFAATPNAMGGYGLSTDMCLNQKGSLRCMLSAQLNSPIFDDPRLHSIYITMQEFTDGGEAEANQELLAQDKDAIRAEYDTPLTILPSALAHVT